MVSEQLEKLEDCSCQQHSRCWSDEGSDLWHEMWRCSGCSWLLCSGL